MVKKSKQSHRFNVPGRVGILATIGCLIAALALAFSLSTYHSLSSVDDFVVRDNYKLRMDHERLQFCYDNDIHPCDDNGIRTFNEKPENIEKDNTFNLTW